MVASLVQIGQVVLAVIDDWMQIYNLSSQLLRFTDLNQSYMRKRLTETCKNLMFDHYVMVGTKMF